MKRKKCLECGKEIIRAKNWTDDYWKKRKFCSRSCYRKNFNKTKIKATCDYCGKEFYTVQSCLKRLGWKNYCSNKCKWLGNQSGCGLTTDGYVWITTNKKQIKLHRYLIEIKLNRKLKQSEIVHHKDFNKLNNSIDNLEIVTKSEHNKIHKFLTKERR